MSGTVDYRCGLEDDPFATKLGNFDRFPAGVPDDAKLKWNLQIGIEDVRHDYIWVTVHRASEQRDKKSTW